MASTDVNVTIPLAPVEENPARADVQEAADRRTAAAERFSYLWPSRPASEEGLAEHDDLPDLLCQLETALEAVVPSGERAWLGRVLEQLRDVRQILGHHTASAGTPDQFVADIDLPSPGLVRRGHKLSRDHAELLVQVRMLLVLIEHEASENEPDFDVIRRRVDLLLSSLRHHEILETDLIYESLCTDIGTGD